VTAVRYDFSKEWDGCVITPTYGDWRIDKYRNGDQFLVRLDSYIPFLEEQNLNTIPFEQIAWKGKNFHWSRRGKYCCCCGGERYYKCDPSIPGIILKGAPNPYNLPYRMVDGKHRIEKLITKNVTESTFYVIDYRTWFETLKPTNVVLV